ncbi:type I-C CRISPR-associated protein Cas8c/Csd1 [Minwuia thermotolerans]|uniref:Type I-C CRISPR-associated protein Cas8c/Csd1 n=1 Tax=Minwuia thermotolerans TaxID=2056226 RepID=A0A2M9G0H7_9PROT|nr:type I-C CRISPR-associated protein Cas8c/Csd1 [Minwuia thermotolerans]PJK29221.1 type I-C CRISPR-associated protein Cas8c/Csd1 [Minwuia thermotolerans]
MTVLQALDRLYGRLADAEKVPPFGYASEKISFCIILAPDGRPVAVRDLRDQTGKRPRPAAVEVPQQASRRTSGVQANFLWDKTSYALGLTADKPGKKRDPASEHRAFVELHETLLRGAEDAGLLALLGFLRTWRPERFEAPPFSGRGNPEDILDANVVFELDGAPGEFVHDRPAARDIWARYRAEAAGAEGMCLVTGEVGPIAELHPAIKGVPGGQMAGTALVSFNLDAFNSFGKKQGANAPVSEQAAFRYTTALNHLLASDWRHGNRIMVGGDTTVVFWAEAPDAARAAAAESLFATLLDPPTDEQEAAPVRETLKSLARGRPLSEISPGVDDATRFFILGLAPNAARLSVRFWLESDLGVLARNAARHHEDLVLEPSPFRAPPSARRLLVETAAQGKRENIPPLLEGALMRAILTGGRYPQTLFSAVIMRLRADRDVNGRRAAILKACLNRNTNREASMSLDRNEANPGYRLGRLFAVMESIQQAALGKTINATIRDRFYGAASATPASVFPVLLRTAGHHLSSIRKGEKGGLARWFEREMGEIVDGLPNAFPRNLRIEDQGRFAIGYYHQRFEKRADAPAEAKDSPNPETVEA